MIFGFREPLWLLLLFPALFIVWIVPMQSYADLGKQRKLASNIIRTILVILIVFALAGVQFLKKSDKMSIVAVVDYSDSIDIDNRNVNLQDLTKALPKAKNNDKFGMVVFGRDSLLELTPEQRVNPDSILKTASKPRGNFTDLASAIRLGLAVLPNDTQKRLVIYTDGNENIGNAASELASANDSGIDTVIYPLNAATGNEVVLEKVAIPLRASKGQTVDLRFTVNSRVETTSKVSIYQDNEYLGEENIKLRAGKTSYTYPVQLDKSGFSTFKVDIDPVQDRLRENNRGYAFTQIEGPPRFLYLSGDENESPLFAQSMRSQQLQFDFGRQGQIPTSPEAMAAYDGIFLSDMPAYYMSDRQMMQFKTAVRDMGRGLVMIGGDQSFGPGGYYDTPIEDALPVTMDYKRQSINPSMAIMLLIDKSGSMSEIVNGVIKVDLAKEACVKVLELIKPVDYVGIMSFDSIPQIELPLTQNIDKAGNIRRVRQIVSGGGTEIYPALVETDKMFRNIKVRSKHIIVLTDGMTAPGDFSSVVSSLRKQGATLTTVAIGTDADLPFLSGLASAGGGNFYQANDPNTLPRIFTRETFLANKFTINEDPFMPRPQLDHPITSGIEWGSTPLLRGFIATTPKPEAQVPLVTNTKDPLLATWRYGIGKSVAWTSDAKNRWASDWVGWDGYNKFFSALTRWVARDVSERGYSAQVSTDSGRGKISVEAVDPQGDFKNFELLKARIIKPDYTSEEISLGQTASGRYEGFFDLIDNGNYLITIVRQDGDKPEQSVIVTNTGLSLSYSPEYQSMRRNDFNLTQLKEVSNALEIQPQELFTADRRPTIRREEIWNWAIILAIIIWLIDIAIRRLQLSKEDFEFILQVVGTPFGIANIWLNQRRAKVTTETLSQLKIRKKEVERTSSMRGPQPSQQIPTSMLPSDRIFNPEGSKSKLITTEKPNISDLKEVIKTKSGTTWSKPIETISTAPKVVNESDIKSKLSQSSAARKVVIPETPKPPERLPAKGVGGAEDLMARLRASKQRRKGDEE